MTRARTNIGMTISTKTTRLLILLDSESEGSRDFYLTGCHSPDTKDKMTPRVANEARSAFSCSGGRSVQYPIISWIEFWLKEESRTWTSLSRRYFGNIEYSSSDSSTTNISSVKLVARRTGIE